MSLIWDDDAWDSYVAWQTKDKKISKRINALLKEINRTPYQGTGQPEPLKYDLSGYWSRRIDRKNRLVYRVEGDDIRVLQCGSHYDDK